MMSIRCAAAFLLLPFVPSLPSAPLPQATQPVPALQAGNGVTAPTLLYKREPEYTDEAKRARLQGSVVLDLVVGPNGTLLGCRVERSLGLGLDANAIEAVKDWRFKPGEKDGKPVAVSVTAMVNYVLPGVVQIIDNGQMNWHLRRAVFQPPAGASRPVFLEATGQAPEGHLSVTLSLVIDESGDPIAVRVPKLLTAQGTEATDLEAAITDFVRAWRFSPASKDGKRIAVSGTFDLELSKP